MSLESSTSDAPAPRFPRRFGRYALIDQIGKGGMAEIFLARAHTDLGAARLCVVKQILRELSDDPQFSEMFIFEAKLAARLSHANIVQVFDLGRDQGELYIAMEYVEGFDVNALLRRCTQQKVPLPFEFVLGIMTDVLRGLDYAHRRTDDAGKPLGIVHRDVSPSNVLVSIEGEVKLCDFGIAAANDVILSASGERMDAAIKGKAGYMSPEHARGEKIDLRADVFAAGILFWELIAGKRMYRREADGSLLDQARKGVMPPIPPRGLKHEEKLHAIVTKALSVDRDARYPTAGAMLRELEDHLASAKILASPLKLGSWMVENFGDEILARRKQVEKTAPPPAVASAPASAPAVASVPVSAPASASAPALPPEPPPSLTGAEMDVVPSSELRRSRAPEPPKSIPRWVWIVMMVLAAAFALFAALRR